ncbi:aldehyde dehydrogenase family 16 member A1-like, partial [Pyrgilauda ruficollis]|uniref:aldehyde dehydrogenase family 16 member A1-like n=1 Tax=Pyrgilauda ruficollis TaxID=221976 RepID=UPI001B86572E
VFQAPLPPLPGEGRRFFPPTLISGVAPTSRCLREPAAGPLLLLLAVRGPAEAVAVARTLPLGPAASVWAQDISTALDTADGLPQGLVCLNSLELPEPLGGSAWGAADTDLDEDCDWASAVSVPRVWGVPAGLVGAPGQDPPPGAERELELRCSRPRCLWLPGGGP